jgi:signal transduction histidine kinase
MIPSILRTFGGWLKDLDARGDAWAAKRLAPDEFAEAVVLDRQLKDNFKRWLGGFVLASVFFGLLVMSVWPQLGWIKAFAFSAAGCLYLLTAFISAWYGWRKFTGKPAWKVFGLFILLLLAGAATGFVVGNHHMGRSLAEMSAEKAMRAMGTAVLMGVVLAAILVGIAHLRLREATQRGARLQAEADRERLARQGVQAELKLLQAQVEPHFLFNTLANVRYLVQSGSPDALAMLDHLIHYLRTALPELRSEGSTLGREAELARAYLEIMRLRMGGALRLEIDVPAGLANHPFPPLMLITLVENALKHGVAPVGRGTIGIRASADAGRVRVEVEDDGAGLGGPIGQGVGLANIRERLRAMHGDAASLALESREPAGTRARIEVPA